MSSLYVRTYNALSNLGKLVLNSKHKYVKKRYAHRWCKEHKVKYTNEQVKAVTDYWNQYTKDFALDFNKLYSSITGTFDVRYIPDDLYYYVIEPYLNKHEYSALDNKIYYPLLFDCKLPEIVINKVNGIYTDCDFRLISQSDAVKLCIDAGKIIIKPSIGSFGGHSIRVMDNYDQILLKDTLDEYKNQSLVIQKFVKQHQQLSSIHENSVNTIRIMTLVINNDIHTLPPVLRMGVNNGFVDNASSGGIVSGILPDGRLKPYAYSASGVKFDVHPQGFIFENCIVPSMDRVIELVKRLAGRFPDFRLMAWDVAIDDNADPVIIEANFIMGELDFMQFNNGPLFGNLTDDVLREVYKK